MRSERASVVRDGVSLGAVPAIGSALLLGTSNTIYGVRLSGMVAVNTVTTEGAVVVDFRLAALAAAALALALRAPFIVVLLVAGGVGALGYVVAG